MEILPAEILTHLRRLTGEIAAIDHLGGMSGGRVVRARGARGSAVAKGGATAAETEFYETVAPVVRGMGIGVPDLRWAGVVGADAERWPIIEAIPQRALGAGPGGRGDPGEAAQRGRRASRPPIARRFPSGVDRRDDGGGHRDAHERFFGDRRGAIRHARGDAGRRRAPLRAGPSPLRRSEPWQLGASRRG